MLSEWLCECAGAAGQSAWNANYLMRIARGHCATGPVALLDALNWMEVAERMLTRQHEQHYGLLQRCGLRLEHAWYAAHTSLEKLFDEMPQLPAADLAFFAAEFRRLPADITAGLKAQQ